MLSLQASRPSSDDGGRFGWGERRRIAAAARALWRAMCQLEVTLKRPLPDEERQAATVAQAHEHVQEVWARHGERLSRQLDGEDGSIVERAVEGLGDGSSAEWENCLARARDTLAPLFR